MGGGFVIKEQETQATPEHPPICPIDTAGDLLAHCKANSCRISDVVMRNELCWRDESEINERLAAIRDTMIGCTYRGCHTDGALPGRLNTQRRAARVARKLLGGARPMSLEEWMAAIRNQPNDFQRVLDWVSCFALAVSEENAAFGRIVTAPTNGSAGVIPAVLLYGLCFGNVREALYADFLLTAGAIGSIFKNGATSRRRSGDARLKSAHPQPWRPRRSLSVLAALRLRLRKQRRSPWNITSA